MDLLILVLGVTSCFMSKACADSDHADSSLINKPDKDMYVIHATVYQIGILTNKTDNMTDKYNSTGNQESVTLYHTNGTNLDLSAIPEALLTNLTAQSVVGVAPVAKFTHDNHSVAEPWRAFDQLTYPVKLPLGNASAPAGHDKPALNNNNVSLHLFKRDVTHNASVKVVKGTAFIPPEAGVQSIGLPPLLFLNNNLSNIPVPIPNTSVVSYAKINTLVKKAS